MQSSNKTGLVLKISLVLFILLAAVVYKLNDYFKNEKLYSVETQVRNKVVLTKTAVSSQLSQLRNTLSSYESGLDESGINWVQLDPFFAIASVDNNDRALKVNQMLVRSNTPAERWNGAYLEKALSINKSKNDNSILAQLFLDKTGTKFLIMRFKTSQNKELVVVGSADYFQKFFDISRGEKGTALLATTEDILVAHSEGDYIATQTSETRLSKKKYLFEKEEIVGTNLIAMNYIMKNKIAAGFVVPWSIVGLVAGFGCILVAVLFYSLDSIERKIERYKKQERAQIYKDTLGDMTSKSAVLNANNPAPTLNSDFVKNRFDSPPPIPDLQPVPEPVKAADKKNLPKDFYSINHTEKEVKVETVDSAINDATSKTIADVALNDDQFLALDSSQIDLSDIEKALALDDFDSEEIANNAASADMLKVNLTPQKVSISLTGAPIDKPHFEVHKKEYKVDEFKTIIRKPEKKPGMRSVKL